MASTDVEDESILANIFKDSFPENWRESSDFLQYLTELSSFGVEKLSKEPERLSEERAQVLEETQELAFHNYKTFIQTAECSREIFEDIIEKHVGGMLEKLPLFSEACNNFLNSAQDISGNRRMNSVTLQRHTQLLEILEVPQLMDTCVRNGYYDEALELAQHVRRWEKKYANIPVVVNIVEEVKGSTQLMLKQLIQQLRTNLQLPACLRVIGYLRRMDVFTEPELRIKFLQARDAWFQGILEGIAKDDAYNHIQKTVEMSRVHLFDIITQYRAIFSDEDLTPIGDTPNESALFHGWVVEKVSQFLHTLETDLQRGLGGRLDSILGQCMYFGLSFSRVGADFRGLLAPIFQQAALQSFQLALVDANRRFEESMQSYSLLTSTSTVSGMAYTSGSQAGQLYPPTSLLDFHPLAAFCNDILTAFNELRLCAPISLAVDVAMAIQSALIEVNKVILGFHRAEESAFDDREREQFGRFCEAYAGDLLPYLNKALNSLFPPAQLCQMLGVTQPQLGKMKNMGVVDKKAVISSIEHLIPVAPDNPEVTDVTPEAMSAIMETTTAQKKAAEAVTSEEEQKPTSIKDSELVTSLAEPGASDAGGSAEDKPVIEEPTKGDNSSASGTDTVFSDTSSQPVRKGSDSVMQESLTKQAEISEQPESVTGTPGVLTVPTVDSLDEKKQD